MVEFLEMAELVDDEVILKLGCERDDLVVEIEIFIARAASPPGALVFDEDFVVGEIIELIEMFKPGVDECAGFGALCCRYR